MFDITTRGPFRTNHPIILASASPRRQALLCSLGIHFEVIPARAKEPAPDKGESPAAYAERMALLKTEEIANKRADAVVIGADTIVVQGPTILGKPTSREHALSMLTSLCGTTHEVITGCCIMHKMGKRCVHTSVSTQVDMPPRDQATLNAYIATGEPMDKAGSYAIQGVGGFLVSGIRGSYTNVVGLPLARILEVLVSWGAIVPQEG
ncbi:Maf family protein [Desulfoplanes sp.]